MDGGHGFCEDDCITILDQITRVVTYNHSKGIIHKDLQAKHILFVNSDSFDIRISHFGISRFLLSQNEDEINDKEKDIEKAEEKHDCTEYEHYGDSNNIDQGILYTAPEIIQKLSYDQRADYWSLGVIMHILLFGHGPFRGTSESEIAESILNDSIELKDDDWQHVSEEGKQLLLGLLEKDPEKRLGSDDILTYTNPYLSRLINMLDNNDLMGVEQILIDHSLDLKIMYVENDLIKHIHSTDMLLLLRKYRFSMNGCDKQGWKLIHYICKRNEFEFLNDIIDINVCNEDNYDISTNIKDKKTNNDNKKNLKNQTPLDIALQSDSVECVESIICTFNVSPSTLNNNMDDKLESRWEKSIEKGSTYAITNNKLKYVVKHDLDNILNAMLVKSLEQEGIEKIESYHDNKIVTFEFLFDLFKLAVKKHAIKCTKVIKYFLQVLSKYHDQSSTVDHSNTNNYTSDQYMCILCLNIINVAAKIANFGCTYCNICNYFICAQCNKHRNPRKDQV